MTNNCHQIYIDGYEECIKTFKRDIKSAITFLGNNNYKFWDYSNISILLEEKEKLAYKKVIPHAYKADLLKYIILYKYGGWIVDPGIMISSCIDTNNTDLLLFKDVPGFQNDMAIANNIMFAQKNHILFKTMIDITCDNILNERYLNTPWDISGPTLLWKVVKDMNFI